MTISSDRSIVFNNAGATLLQAGYHEIAQDLFLGALEYKRHEITAEESGVTCTPRGQNIRISAAERILASFAAKDVDSHFSQQGPSVFPQQQGIAVGIDENMADVGYFANNGQDDLYFHGQLTASLFFEPKLLSCPLLINEDELSSYPDTVKLRTECAIILLNIGILRQCYPAKGNVCISFYKMSMELLSDYDSINAALKTKLILWNNIGIWLFANNGSMDEVQMCMENVSALMNQTGVSDMFRAAEWNGLNESVQWFCCPTGNASPAA